MRLYDETKRGYLYDGERWILQGIFCRCSRPDPVPVMTPTRIVSGFECHNNGCHKGIASSRHAWRLYWRGRRLMLRHSWAAHHTSGEDAYFYSDGGELMMDMWKQIETMTGRHPESQHDMAEYWNGCHAPNCGICWGRMVDLEQRALLRAQDGPDWRLTSR